MEQGHMLGELGLLLLAAVGGGIVAHLLRQPLIVGYILGGIVVSPFTPGPRISNPHAFEIFADIGVVLLMFSIGIEFSLHELVRVRKVALYAPAGILLIIACWCNRPCWQTQLPTIAILVLLVAVGNFSIWLLLLRVAGYGRETAGLAALSLTQIGEFSYVLSGTGLREGLITGPVYQAILATSLVTITMNALLFRRTPKWLQKLIA